MTKITCKQDKVPYCRALKRPERKSLREFCMHTRDDIKRLTELASCAG
jgi:hypothetical protein